MIGGCARVQIVQHTRDLDAVAKHLLLQQRRVGLVNALLERLAGDELHHQHGRPWYSKKSATTGRFGWLQRAEQLGLLQEQLAVFLDLARPARPAGGRISLSAQIAPSAMALRAIDRAHAAAPDHARESCTRRARRG